MHPRVYVSHSGAPTRRQREWAEVLADVQAGTRSVLEQRYLREVERALSTGRSGTATPLTGGQTCNATSTRPDGHVTLRPGWAQVLEPCRLAGVVAAVLIRRGWIGRPGPCGDECAVDDGAGGPT